jgi:hypothetical protein
VVAQTRRSELTDSRSEASLGDTEGESDSCESLPVWHGSHASGNTSPQDTESAQVD